MPNATASQVADMDKKLGEVHAALGRAEEQAEELRSFPGSWTRTPAQDSMLKNLDVLKARHRQWADRTSPEGWRRWALEGQTPTGQAYPVAFWLRIGDDFLSELTGKKKADGSLSAGLAQGLPSAGTAAAASAAIQQSKKDVEELADKAKRVVTDPWPLHWKLAAGAAAALAALGLGAVVLGQLKPLLSLLPDGKETP